MKDLKTRELMILLRGLSNLKTYNDPTPNHPSSDEVFNLMGKLNLQLSKK
tara:strand:+ start:853 stop:1002 length:150 start_codon:yes stop_codon:yes gene_type:complete